MRYRNTTQIACCLTVFDSANRELRFPCEPDATVDVPDEFDKVVPMLAPQLRKDETDPASEEPSEDEESDEDPDVDTETEESEEPSEDETEPKPKRSRKRAPK